MDLVVEPKVDTWNQQEKVDLVVVDLARADGEGFGEAAKVGSATTHANPTSAVSS